MIASDDDAKWEERGVSAAWFAVWLAAAARVTLALVSHEQLDTVQSLAAVVVVLLPVAYILRITRSRGAAA